jgi:multidrug resistance protein, MATE family
MRPVMDTAGNLGPPRAAAAGEARFALWRREALAGLRLGAPLAGAQLAQIALMATDTVMLAWLGPDGLAAGALGMHVFSLFLFAGTGLAVAVAPLAAQAVGARDPRRARRALRQGLWATAASSIPFLVLLWNSEPLLLALGQAPEIAAPAAFYLRALMWSLVPGVWFVVMRSYIAAHGSARAVFVVMLAAVPLNAGLVYVTVFGKLGLPALGVVGAGLSTSAVNLAMAAALALYLTFGRRFRRLQPFGRWWRQDWAMFADIFRVGAPIAGIHALEVGLFSAAALMMGWFGTPTLAAYQIAIQVASVTFMVPLGLSQAATVRVGLAVGQGDLAAAGRAGWTSLAVGFLFMCAMAVILWLAPEAIVILFLEDTVANRPVIDLAISFLLVAAAFQIFDGAQVIAIGVLRGYKDTRMPMLIAAFGYWGVGCPGAAAFSLAAGLQGVGVWIGLAMGLAAVALMLLARFAWRDRRNWLGAR